MKSHYWKLLLLVPVVLLGATFLLRTRRPKSVLGIGAPATAIAFSPDGKTLVCASSNNYVQMWIPERGKWRSFYREFGGGYGRSGSAITQLCFAGDGRTLFAGGTPDNFGTQYSYAWEIPSRKLLFEFGFASTPAFDVSRDGHYAVVGATYGVFLVDLKSKPKMPQNADAAYRSQYPPSYRHYQVKRLSPIQPTSVAFSPNGKTLAMANSNWSWGTALWDVATKKPLPNSGSTQNSMASLVPPLEMEWSPDGTQLAAVWADKIAIWNTKTQNAREATFPTRSTGSALPVSSGLTPPTLAWTPDGETLFSGGDEVRQWHVADLSLERAFGISGPVAVTPDGKTLATANVPQPGGVHGILMWKLK